MSPLSRHRDGRARTSKHTRKVRRANADLRRQVRRMSRLGRSAYATLLAVLAQHSGEITVTQGTLDQVGAAFDRLSFVVEKKADTPNEFVVKIVETEVQAGNPADSLDGGTTDAEEETNGAEAVV